jgi:hypothetical protein
MNNPKNFMGISNCTLNTFFIYPQDVYNLKFLTLSFINSPLKLYDIHLIINRKNLFVLLILYLQLQF